MNIIVAGQDGIWHNVIVDDRPICMPVFGKPYVLRNPNDSGDDWVIVITKFVLYEKFYRDLSIYIRYKVILIL